MKLKKLLALFIATAMVLSTMSFTAFAENSSKGNLYSCCVNTEKSDRTFIKTETRGIDASESIELRIYDDEENLLATTTATEKTVALKGNISIFTGINCSDPERWTTEWKPGMLRGNVVPSKAKLYIDGEQTSELEFEMKDYLNNKLDWADVEGVFNPHINGTYLGGTYENAYLCVEVYDFYLDETFEVKYYSNDEHIATASLKEGMLTSGAKESIGSCLGFNGDFDEYWSTEWVVPANAEQVPNKVEIYVDGVKITEKVGPFGNGIKGWDPASNGNWLYELIAEDWVKINGVNSVAIANNKFYASLDSAIADAAGAEIVLLKDAELNTKLNNATININLNGYTMNVNVGANYIIGENSISNGTIDISNASSSQNIFGLAQYATPATTLTMDNVTFIGDGFNSGYAVFEIGNSGAEAALNIIDSTINLKNDNADQGGFVKGYGANCVLEIINTDVTLDNTDMFGVHVAANIVDSKFVVNNLTDTAFRNFGGTIANSVISIDNSGNGIRNSGAEYDLAIENNSSVVISGSTNTEEGKIGDLVLAAGCTVDVDDTSELLVETSSIANGDDATGNVVPKADKVYVQFKEVATDADETKLYDIVLVGANAEKINELASADLTFEFNGIPAVGSKNINCEIAAKEGVMLTKLDNRYMFNYNGIDLHEETDNKIVIGTVTVTGYGTFTFKTSDVPTNAVYATEIRDSIVDEFKTAAATLVINEEMEASGEPDDGMVGKIESEIKVPVRTLTVNVDFPNAVVDNAVAYQDMKVEIAGNIDGKNQTVTYDLGKDGKAMTDGSYKVVEEKTVVNNKYTVTVSGAGYRTVSYTVTMDDNKTLNFWNNVKDDAQPVEEKKTTGFVNTTFLAGDIVKDANINIYDLSAVVAYFGTATNNDVKYSKYDLNRDGDIDSKDVAYVLVSWNN